MSKYQVSNNPNILPFKHILRIYKHMAMHIQKRETDDESNKNVKCMNMKKRKVFVTFRILLFTLCFVVCGIVSSSIPLRKKYTQQGKRQ